MFCCLAERPIFTLKCRLYLHKSVSLPYETLSEHKIYRCMCMLNKYKKQCNNYIKIYFTGKNLAKLS